MKKPTRRNAFNFLRSYFDVYNEIPEPLDKLSFIDSIINKQFLNEDPKGLEFIPHLSYESQRHQVESSVKGWETRTGNKLGHPTLTPTEGGNNIVSNPTEPPYGEEEEKEEEQGEVEVEEQVQVQEQVQVEENNLSRLERIIFDIKNSETPLLRKTKIDYYKNIASDKPENYKDDMELYNIANEIKTNHEELFQ